MENSEAADQLKGARFERQSPDVAPEKRDVGNVGKVSGRRGDRGGAVDAYEFLYVRCGEARVPALAASRVKGQAAGHLFERNALEVLAPPDRLLLLGDLREGAPLVSERLERL